MSPGGPGTPEQGYQNRGSATLEGCQIAPGRMKRRKLCIAGERCPPDLCRACCAPLRHATSPLMHLGHIFDCRIHLSAAPPGVTRKQEAITTRGDKEAGGNHHPGIYMQARGDSHAGQRALSSLPACDPSCAYAYARALRICLCPSAAHIPMPECCATLPWLPDLLIKPE